MNYTKILVVDDDTKIVYAFRRLLENEGCICIDTQNGRGVIHKIKEERPQAVFLDVSLPDYKGFEVLKKIMQMEPAIPVIIITSHCTKEIQRRVHELGAVDILEKPLTIIQIRKVILRIRLRDNPGSVAYLQPELPK